MFEKFPQTGQARSWMMSASILVACAPTVRPAASSDATSPRALTTVEPPSEFDPARYHSTQDFSGHHEAPALIRPARPACAQSAVNWSAALRLNAEAEVFAEVSWGNSVTVLIPEGDASQGAFVEVHARGLRLEGRVVASDVAFGLRRSTLLGGYAWTRGSSALRWKHASAQGLELELDPGPRVRPLGGPLIARSRCEELTLEATSAGAFEAAVVLSRGRALRETEWLGEERVPLSLTPMGSPVAELDTRPESDVVEPESDEVEPESDEVELERAWVIGAHGGFRRVLYALEDVVVMGWVPASALRRDTEPHGELVDLSAPSAEWGMPIAPFGHDDPTQRREPSASESTKPRWCAWNAPLTVEIAGVKRQVGTIASGIPLALAAGQEGLREVTFEHPSVSASAAQFWVPDRLLYPCRGRAESEE